MAELRFRHKWLASDNAPHEHEDAPRLDNVLWQVGSAISGLKDYQQPLDLSADECSYLTEVVEKWSDIPVLSHFEHVSYEVEESVYEEDLLLHDYTRSALYGLSSILAEITVSEAVGGKLLEKLQGFGKYDIPGFRLIPGLTKAMPHRLDELVSTMRMGLVSDKAELAISALQGLRYWLGISDEEAAQVEPPPDDLVREIGVIIATRRKATLGEALRVAKWVFDYRSDAHRECIAEFALYGLGYLAEELRYDRFRTRDSDINIDAVPRLRWLCAQLVSSMEKHGYKDHPVVKRWLQIIEEDPLPEVRYARSPVFTRQPEAGASVEGGPDSDTE